MFSTALNTAAFIAVVVLLYGSAFSCSLVFSLSRKLPLWHDVPLRWKLEGGSLEQAIARRVKSVTTVHQKAVVPHDNITDLPVVFVNELRARRMGTKFRQ